MQLTDAQIAQYDRDGFLVFHDLFSPAEVAALKQDLVRIQSIDTDHLVRERSGGVAKTIYRVHEDNGPTASIPFLRAARSSRFRHDRRTGVRRPREEGKTHVIRHHFERGSGCYRSCRAGSRRT